MEGAHDWAPLAWGRGRYQDHSAASHPQEKRGSGWLDGYFLAKSRLSYRCKWMKAGFVVDNMCDEDHSTEEEGSPMPPRSTMA